MSERDGWNHLYLFNGVTGRRPRLPKATGPSATQKTDEARQIWFGASGMSRARIPTSCITTGSTSTAPG